LWRLHGVRGQLGTGRGHGQFGQVLAGGLVHLPEAEDREPVKQGGEAEREVVESRWRSEGALLDTALDDGGEIIAPWCQ
jgi:hypothetical protein